MTHVLVCLSWPCYSSVACCFVLTLCDTAAALSQQAVTELQQQQQQSQQQGQYQVLNGQQQQQQQASLQWQQQLADRQTNQQQQLPFTALRQQPASTRQRLRQGTGNPPTDLLSAIHTAGGYSRLCALVSEASSSFQPHHTAAALLRLANIVTGRDLAAQQAAAASAAADELFAEQDWAGPQVASLDAAADSPGSPRSPGTASRDEAYSSSSSLNGYAGRSSFSSSNSSLSRYVGAGAGRGNGLAGLIAVPGSEVASSSSSSSVGSSSSVAAAESAGFLSGATMAARMAAARQQQWEQQQLRQQAWGFLPAQQQQQWLDAASDADSLATQQQLDGGSFSMLSQQQQWLQQQQQVVDYGPLLRRLLALVRNQAENMSGSAGLSVLTALALMRAQPDAKLLQRLLKHPLYLGLPKLRPAGLVAVGARLAALQAQPSERWLKRYVALLLQQRDMLSGQQLASLVGSLAALGWRSWPEAWGAALAGRCSSALSSMEGQELLAVAQVRCLGRAGESRLMLLSALLFCCCM
jgi:hypothetical protein